MDTSSSDTARLLRLLAVRPLTLALLVGITGETLLTLLFALTGLGLLLIPVKSAGGPPTSRPWGRSSARRRPCSGGITRPPLAQTTRAGCLKPGRRSAAASRKLVSAAAARSVRTASRRISGCFMAGFAQRAVAASPRRVSHPNAIGSRRSGRSLICCMNSPNIRGESLPVSTSVLPVSPGGKLSSASHETSTTRPRRAAPSHMSSWTSAPPVSLPTRVTSCRSRRSRNSATSRATPGSDRSASACIA